MEGIERDSSSTVIRTILVGVLLLVVFAVIYAEHAAKLRNAVVLNQLENPTKYTNFVYRINLSYPSGWQPTPGSNYDSYSGSDGFFNISATETKPTSLLSEKLTVDGQEALVIDSKELVVKYPKPVKIGNDTFNFFVLKADNTHLLELANSLTFVR